jgi:hypothetical protein
VGETLLTGRDRGQPSTDVASLSGAPSGVVVVGEISSSGGPARASAYSGGRSSSGSRRTPSSPSSSPTGAFVEAKLAGCAASTTTAVVRRSPSPGRSSSTAGKPGSNGPRPTTATTMSPWTTGRSSPSTTTSCNSDGSGWPPEPSGSRPACASPPNRPGAAPADITDHFHLRLRQAGLPPIGLHGLRHGAATINLAAGVDMRVVQEPRRHSSITVTVTSTPPTYPTSPSTPPRRQPPACPASDTSRRSAKPTPGLRN